MTDHHESATDHESHEPHPENQPQTSQTDKPSQAEGEDPGNTGTVHEVIPAEGKPSQADA